ncbi:MAG: HRDC domain-containing protein [Synergistaceae bacterium]|nr:HRDC domain-containing protein [Synergistaceae bacterium]
MLLPELKPEQEFKSEQEVNQELTLNLSDDDAELYNILRGVRMRLAGQEKVSAFIICHNEVLKQMVLRKPRNITELLSISGIGEVKAERYGDAFLEQIIKWLDRD